MNPTSVLDRMGCLLKSRTDATILCPATLWGTNNKVEAKSKKTTASKLANTDPAWAGLCLHDGIYPAWRGSARLPTPRGDIISGSSGRSAIKRPAKKCTAAEYQQTPVTFFPAVTAQMGGSGPARVSPTRDSPGRRGFPDLIQ